MSEPQYLTSFNDHPVHESLEKAREALALVPGDLLKAGEAGKDPEGWLSRLRPVFDHIGTLLVAADPALVNLAALDSLHQQLEQITAALNALRDLGEWGQIQTIQVNGEGLLNTTMQFAPALGIWADEDLQRTAAKLGRAAGAKSRSLQGQLGNLQGRLNQLDEQIDGAFASLKEKSGLQTDQIDTQLESLTADVDAVRTRIDQAVSVFEADFATSQNQRAGLFEETRDDLSERGAEAIASIEEAGKRSAADEQERAEIAIAALRASGNEVIDFLNAKKDQAAELIDLVTTSATAGAFGKEAKDQREAADRWRKGAVVIAVIAGVVSAVSVFLSLAYEPSTAETIGKVFSVAVLLSVAAYAANQSAQHRRREQRAKRLELELVVFGPFTEPLAPEEQNQVRKELIERLFVGDPGDGEKRPAEADAISDEQFNLLTQAVRLVKESQK